MFLTVALFMWVGCSQQEHFYVFLQKYKITFTLIISPTFLFDPVLLIIIYRSFTSYESIGCIYTENAIQNHFSR